MSKPSIDLHAHPTLKAFANYRYDQDRHPEMANDQYDLWKNRPRKLDSWFLQFLDNVLGLTAERNIDPNSETHFEAAAKGNVRLICASLYPIEREFLILGKRWIMGNKGEKLLKFVTGFSIQKIKEIVKKRPAYFDEYIRDMRLLLNSQSFKPTDWCYAVAFDGSQVAQYLNQDKKIVVVGNAEGVQCFAPNIKGQEKRFYQLRKMAKNWDDSYTKTWRNEFKENLKQLKSGQLKHPDSGELFSAPVPFYVTFAHHFFNYSSGHSPSLKMKVGGFVFDQSGKYEERTNGKREKRDYHSWDIINPFGLELIELLLNDSEGQQRILIDTKHMSPAARVEYHRIAKAKNIPIICSHTACNTLASMHNPQNDQKGNHDFYAKSQLNLYDDELCEIIDSEGLIGVCMLDGRLAGHGQLKTINQVVKQYQKLPQIGRVNSREERALKQVYCELILSHIFHIVLTYKRWCETKTRSDNYWHKAWSHITIGTDYDGGINPIDVYREYGRFPELRDDLAQHWNLRANQQNITWAINQMVKKNDYLPVYEQKHFNDLLQLNGQTKTPDFFLDKIFYDNAQEFIIKQYK